MASKTTQEKLLDALAARDQAYKENKGLRKELEEVKEELELLRDGWH